MIESGAVEPHTATPVADARLEVIARERVQGALESGIHLDFEAVLQELRRDPPPNLSGRNHVCHNGRYYLDDAFPRLPRTEAVDEALRFCATEAAAILIGFFVARSYAVWSPELEAVIASLAR